MTFPFQEGELFAGLRIGEFLGQGHSASVWRVADGEQERALKVYFPQLDGTYPDLQLRRIDLELKAGQLGYPNLLTVYRRVDGEHQGRSLVGVLMDFVPGQDLGKYIATNGPMPEAEVRAMGVVLCKTVQHLHSRQMVHRDIKPGNILLSGPDRTPILADLGVVILPGIAEAGTETGDFVGSWRYAAPEYLRDDPPGAGNSPPSDIYSLGTTLYEMITGLRPFAEIVNRAQLGEAVTQRTLTISRSDVSQELRNLIYRMVMKSPDRRPALQDVISLLSASSVPSSERNASVDPDSVIRRFAASPEIVGAEAATKARVEHNRFLNSIHTHFKNHWELRRPTCKLSQLPGLIGIDTDPPGLGEWPNIADVMSRLPDRKVATFFGVGIQMEGRILTPCVIYLVTGDASHVEINRFTGMWTPSKRLMPESLHSWAGNGGAVFDWVREQVAESERLIFELLITLNPSV